jgi:hypothetical protein
MCSSDSPRGCRVVSRQSVDSTVGERKRESSGPPHIMWIKRPLGAPSERSMECTCELTPLFARCCFSDLLPQQFRIYGKTWLSAHRRSCGGNRHWLESKGLSLWTPRPERQDQNHSSGAFSSFETLFDCLHELSRAECLSSEAAQARIERKGVPQRCCDCICPQWARAPSK